MRTHLIKVLNSLSTALALSLCASASTLAATHTIGGTIKGLTSSNSVTLLDDGTDALKVTANGAFTFKTPLAAGASYNVTIGTQPTDELCTVSHGSGLANANISSVLVSCVRTFSIGGTLSGLKSGDSVTLLDNRKDALPLTANGKFTFSTSLTTGAAYSVTVITEPLGEKCTISHANGVVAANVTNIAVSCVAAPMFTIGGSVSGLRAGDSVTLLDNGADPLKVSSNSTFKFKTPLDSGTLYKVTVGTQPSTGDCKVSAATGIVRSSNITTVKVTCVPTFSIGGTLTGLKSGDSLTLLDNRTDALTLTANGKFTFATRLPSGSAYRLGISITPLGEKCTVTHGVGVVAVANVTNISVSCVTAPTHTVGGIISGLKTGDQITLLDNGADALTLTASGPFTFKTPLESGTVYKVTIGTQPPGEDCTVAAATGVIANANITSVKVTCTTAGTHTIGGTVSGLKTGNSVTLLDNGADALKVTADGRFTFKTPLAPGASYAVTVGTQPAGQICTITNGSGKVPRANVTNVTAICTAAPTFTIGGTLSGLTPGALLSLFNNGADQLNLATNGAFAFRLGLLPGAAYNVTIAAQPTGETCTVSNGSGTVGTSNVTTVSVSCKANPTFIIGGTVSGLNTGASVTLLDNATDSLTVSTNGAFTFKTALATGAAYNVTVNTQPVGETCTVTGATGTVASSNVTTVSVSCKANPTFTIGGTVSGLSTGASVTLLDSATDSLTVSTNGAFTFKTALATGAAYNVTVNTQPVGETCTVTGATGTVASSNVTTVSVSCKANPTFTIGGTVSGLSTGASVTLLDSATDSLTVSTNGAFTFKTALATGAAYNVTVNTQPVGETCTVTGATGTVASSNVTTVSVSCKANPTFTIGGTVSGLNTGASVTLLDNATDSLTVSTNGTFTFKTALATGAGYDVTIASQPSNETCTITNASGTVASANVSNVSVSCVTNTFTIGGTVNGLNSGASVTLLDNATDSLTIITNGTLTFKTPLATGATYNVTIATQPTNETCTITNASGTVVSANITNVSVSCATNTFTIGGTVSGLNTGASVTLLDNATDSLTIITNGTFTFKTPLATGATYNVTIATQPTNETCTITNASGTVVSANITNVSVSCATNTFTIGGTVSGLNTGASVTLLDNATDSLTVGTNGAFTFKIAHATGAAYSVTVSTQPTGQTCTITNGTGTVASANITNVNVSCSSGTGGSGTFWTPYTASPVPGTSGGSTGLFIMPSDNLESSPAPQFVTTAQPHFLGSAFQFTFGNGTVTSTPAVFIYAAAGTDGNTHVYGLKVGDTSTVPTPTQLSSLSLSPSQQICGFSQAQTSLADPTTVFTILDVSPGQCGTGGDIFEVVRYQDSPTTAPTPVSINTTLIYTLYQDGNLAGLILYDTNAQSLNLYADGTFTSLKQLATGSASLGLRLATLTDGTTFGGTVAYFNVTTSSGPALYRIDSSSLTLSQVHQGVLGLVAVPDKNNLYFTDVTSLSTTVFYQVPLAGGTPTAIYSAPYTSGLSSYLLLGTDDSVLAFQFLTTIGSPIGTTTNFFYSIPIGTTSTTATTLGGPYVGNVTAVVASPKLADFAGTVIFVDIINKLAGTPQQTAYSSVALPLSGTTNTTPLANSSYPPMGPTRIVQVTGITDVDGGQGGGTLSNIDLNTLQGTILTTTGGQPYVIPAGYVPGPVSLGSNFVGGQLVPFPGTTGPSIGLAGDLSNNFILPINLPNTNVSIF